VKPNRSIPPSTVIPVLVYPDVRQAVAWLSAAFGFAERTRIGESHRAQMSIGEGGAMIVADVRGEQRPPQSGIVTHVMKVRVEDVGAWYERARAHGARRSSHPPTGSTASGNAPSRTWPATAGSSPRRCETWRPRNTAARQSRPGPDGDQIAIPRTSAGRRRRAARR
jgi:Glyoxalase/Bleomycin resistance protein/Dioxygenase superfamily